MNIISLPIYVTVNGLGYINAVLKKQKTKQKTIQIQKVCLKVLTFTIKMIFIVKEKVVDVDLLNIQCLSGNAFINFYIQMHRFNEKL